MPPGKVLQPVLKMKVDELFLCWLSEAGTQRMLQDGLRRIQAADRAEPGAGDARAPGTPVRPASPAPPLAPPPARRSAGPRVVQAQKEAPRPPPSSQNIPAFYFPRGRPGVAADDVDALIARVESTFAQFPHERATASDMGQVAKACGCPLYWKGPLFYGAGGERTGSVSVHKFVAMWRKVLHTCYDDAARFVHLLVSPGCSSLAPEDFVPFLQDVVNTHPGLCFLKEASEFHSRYITTVIQRIFYTVNRSWSGRITCAELRRSSFLQNVALLEEEADINQLPEFFSYEHFYVIYCKFWELDTDHDLLIDAQDLARHNDHAVSSRMIERIFSGAVTRGRRVQKEGRLSYADFVWFLISEEDKTTPTSIEYWFRCMDLDGDGTLSMFELEFFYEEQCRRLDAMGIEPLPFQDCLCQVLDLVRPRCPGRITLRDLKRCQAAGAFFDTFFNVEKYLEREQAALPRVRPRPLRPRVPAPARPGPRRPNTPRARPPGRRQRGPRALRLGEVRRRGVRCPGGRGGRGRRLGGRVGGRAEPGRAEAGRAEAAVRGVPAGRRAPVRVRERGRGPGAAVTWPSAPPPPHAGLRGQGSWRVRGGRLRLCIWNKVQWFTAARGVRDWDATGPTPAAEPGPRRPRDPTPHPAFLALAREDRGARARAPLPRPVPTGGTVPAPSAVHTARADEAARGGSCAPTTGLSTEGNTRVLCAAPEAPSGTGRRPSTGPDPRALGTREPGRGLGSPPRPDPGSSRLHSGVPSAGSTSTGQVGVKTAAGRAGAGWGRARGGPSCRRG